MQRSLLPLLQTTGMVLLVGTLSLGATGCIPAFRGLKPVSKTDLEPKQKPKSPAEVLFHEEYRMVRYGQVGQFGMRQFIRVHQRMRINSRKGFQHATRLLSGGEVTALNIRTTCPDGRVAKMGLSDVQQVLKDNYSNGMYGWSSKAIKFTAPGVGVGCIIDFFWERDVPYFSPNLTLSFLSDTPVRKAEYTFVYDEQKKVRVELKNLDPLWMILNFQRKKAKKPALKQADKDKHVKVQHLQGERTIKLMLTDIPAKPRKWGKIVHGTLLPSRFMSSPRLAVSMVKTYGLNGMNLLTSWKDLDKGYTASRAWYWDTRSRVQRTYQIDEDGELNEKGLPGVARKLTQNLSKRDDKIKAIYEHVRRRMRRSGRGMSSPRKLYLLYLLGRGTNYEINMIYIVMLRSVGIRAYPALIATGNRTFHTKAPSQPFRSVGTYIAPEKDGTWKGIHNERRAACQFASNKGSSYKGGRKVTGGQVLDPSQKFYRFGDLPSGYNGVHAFVIDGAGGRFFGIPETDPNRNRFKHVYNIQIAADGTMTGTFTQHNWGPSAASKRAHLHNLPKRSWVRKRALWKGFAALGCGSEANVSLANQPNVDIKGLSEPFKVTYKFKMPFCASHGKHGIVFSGSLPIAFSASLRAKERTYPLNLGTPNKAEVEWIFTLPKGYKVKAKPAQLAASGPGVTGTVASKVNGNVLTIKATKSNVRRQLPASTYEKIQGVYKLFGGLRRPFFAVAPK